jgi:hypothetical protein
MAILVAIEAVAILLLGLLVAGLLRSHADILRALHALGIDLDGNDHGVSTPVDLGMTVLPRTESETAFDVTGTTPGGEVARFAIPGARHDTLLAFLTSGCSTCAAFWDAFGELGGFAGPNGARVLIVTHDAGEESVSRLRDLAPRAIPVVLSSQAWAAYHVPVAPYFIYVSGQLGRVVGEGAGSSWSQVTSLLGQAQRDATASTRKSSPDRKWDSREERADSDLATAGILPGDPRLYPAQIESAPGDPGHG